MMNDWDKPERSRLFLILAAALLVSRLGSDGIFGEDPIRSEAKPAAIAVTSYKTAGAEAAPVPFAASLPDRDSPFASDGLRDAVASMSAAAWAEQAARSAAFAGPSGRLPGAYAPSAAASAQAARRSMPGATSPGSISNDRDRAAERASKNERRQTPQAAPASAARRAGAAANGLPPPEGQTPAQRFFSSAAGRWPRASSHGVAAAGSTAFAAEASPRQRQARSSARRLRPALLSRLLGGKPLTAPKNLAVAKNDPWIKSRPQAGPHGRPLSVKPLGYAAAESVSPPPTCRKPKAHWHEESKTLWWHDGPAWGRDDGISWSWLTREKNRWWLWPQPAQPPLLRHQDHWWLQNRGMWFLLHDGEPWGYQYLSEWRSAGFVNSSGAQMIYSADGTRVGLIVPNEGAILYDAISGQELGRWRPDQLPRRFAASVPAALPQFQ